MQIQALPSMAPKYDQKEVIDPIYQQTLKKIKKWIGGEEVFDQLPLLDFSTKFPQFDLITAPIMSGINSNGEECLVLKFQDKKIALFIQNEPTLKGWYTTFIDYSAIKSRMVPLNKKFIQAAIAFQKK